MFIISAIILSLSLMMGAQVPSSAPVDTAPVSVQVEAECLEDMPCWDCETMGNKQCGPTMEVDAWDAIDTAKITNTTDTEMMLSYMDTQTGQPTNLPTAAFTIESNTIPNLFHVFKWEVLSKA